MISLKKILHNWNYESESYEITFLAILFLYFIIVFLPPLAFVCYFLYNIITHNILSISSRDIKLIYNLLFCIFTSSFITVLSALSLRLFVLPKWLEKIKQIFIVCLIFNPSFFFSFGYFCFYELFQDLYFFQSIPLSYPKGYYWVIVCLCSAFLPLVYLLTSISLNFYKTSSLQAIELFCDSPIKIIKFLILSLKGLILDMVMLTSWIMIGETAIFMQLQVSTITSDFITLFIQGRMNYSNVYSILLIIIFISGIIGSFGITRFISIIKSHSIQNNILSYILKDNSPNFDNFNCYSIQKILRSYINHNTYTILTILGNIPLILLILPFTGIIYRAISNYKNIKFSMIVTIDSFLYTIIVASIVAIISTFISFYLGNWIINSQKLNIFKKTIICLPFFMPGVVSGFIIAYLGNFLTNMFSNNFIKMNLQQVIILVGHLAKSLPFCLIISIIFRKNLGKPECIESIILFSNKFFERIKLEFNRILTLFIVGFFVSFKEIDASLLTVPPGYETLTLRMFNFIHYGATTEVALFMLILSILFSLFIFIISKKIA